MKTLIKLLLIYFILFMSLLTSSSGKKADQIIDSDKLTGTWNVTETANKTTLNYSATITKEDNKTIIISSVRESPPVYFINNLKVTVKWAEKVIVKKGSTIKGKITNENDFEIHYLFGAGITYYVKLHFTR